MISTKTEGPIRRVVLDRRERRNALTVADLEALESVVAGATEPVVYLHGAGSAFCAGADLEVIRSLSGQDATAFARRGQQTLNAIENADSVVVAGIDGPARGGGVELALAADIRIATPAATFAEPGVGIGIFGAWGGTHRLPAAVGSTHAADLSLTGRTIDAQTALSIGLVSRVTEKPRSVAEAVAANDADALATLKHLLRDRTRPPDERERREATAFADLLGADR